MKRMKRFTYTLVCAAMTAAFTAPLASCSNDFDAVENVDDFVGEEINVCSFPAFTTDGSTRATDEKSSWDSNDVIYVQVNGKGEWYALSYADGKWSAPEGFSMKKTDTYKAVYAPNYAPNDDNVLALKSGKVASTAEYLTCEGTRPINISFVRNYSRLRLSATANATISVSFGEGFTANDGTDVKSFELTTDGDGDAYVYGSWSAKTKLDIEGAIEGNPSEDAVYVVNNQLSNNIANASVASKAYHVTADETWVINNLDNTTTSVSDWSSYSDYKNLKVIGTWDEGKAPKLAKTNNLPFTRISLSSLTGLTTIPEAYFRENTTIERVDLPETVEEIEGYAFYKCSSLTIKELPKATTTLGDAALGYCNIAFKSMPYVTNVGYFIFYGCTFTGDGSFEWPSGITSIPASTFKLSNLETITIPKEVTSIDEQAFWNCNSLTAVICKGVTAPNIPGSSQFSPFNFQSDCTLYIPTGSKDNYTNAGWGDFFTNIIETDFSE
jgi:hypothetical protein